MRASLQIHKHDDADDYSAGKRFRFVVVDLNKGKDYPVNFVCLLPMQPNSLGKGFSVFVGIFGDKSLIAARNCCLRLWRRRQILRLNGRLRGDLNCLSLSLSIR